MIVQLDENTFVIKSKNKKQKNESKRKNKKIKYYIVNGKRFVHKYELAVYLMNILNLKSVKYNSISSIKKICKENNIHLNIEYY